LLSVNKFSVLYIESVNTSNSKSKDISPLGLFIVEYQVGSLAYCLKLPYVMKKLHLIFNIVKLFTTPEDPILRRKPKSLLPPIIIDREEK